MDLVYGYDPLCGWCFGAGPAMARARAELGDDVRWELACGGLVTGERVRPVALDRDYLLAGLEQVAATTGVRAGRPYYDGLLTEGTWVSDSEPPCRALRVALDLAPDRAIDLGHAISRALYVDGLAPDEPDTLRRCADGVGIDGEELVRRWAEPAARTATAVWFAETRARGVRVYPSLFARTPDGLVPLGEGYVPADQVVARVRQVAALVG